MPVLPSRKFLRAAVLPAARLQDVFETASKRKEALLRQRLLRVPILEDLASLPQDCLAQSMIQGLTDLHFQPDGKLDNKHILQHCSKQALHAMQQHFQPETFELLSSDGSMEEGACINMMVANSIDLPRHLRQVQCQSLPLPIPPHPAHLAPSQVGKHPYAMYTQSSN